MRSSFYSVGLLALLAAGSVAAQLAPNAPQDQARGVTQRQLADFENAIAPYIAAARKSYPEARAKFLKGLPPGQHFFVVTRVHDSQGRSEQVFVRVQTIQGDLITGILSSEVKLLTNIKLGQPYTLKEQELMDWVITKPDGSEEGNVVGKFLDTYRPQS